MIDKVFYESAFKTIKTLISKYEVLLYKELDENLSRRYYSILMSLYDIKEDLKDGKVF